jgi:hypothetical protein
MNDFWNTTNVVAFSSAIAGAFFGSASAFWLGRLQQKRDLRDRRHSALIATQYALLSQWNILENIRRNLFEPHRQDPMRFAKMPLYHIAKAHCAVPFSEITFIANSDDTNLLQQIHIAEQSYLSTVQTLDLCNEKREAFFKDNKAHQFDIKTGTAKIETTEQEIFVMKTVTDALYNQVDDALKKLEVEPKNIWKFVKRNFKGMKAIEMKPYDQK